MDLVGKMLAGRYEIIEEVGKGGMAHVYKARCHFLNRYVAVKVLKEEHRDDKEFVNRFNTEAQAAARISNPHVVSIFDVGYESGLYYIVMEYVEGITLKEYISENRRLPWRQAAEFAAQICEGLDAAHKKSVIHRDIKPQNIIMTKGDILKITDFGIARATTQATTTTANSTIGTVHYLSPEQARGGYTNEKTDIYSLGIVLYEMLTGRVPFDDNTAVAIAIKHIQEKPVLPRILNNNIPKSMEYIVMKALNKEQDLRYASAADFLDDLRKVIKNPDAVLGVTGQTNAEDDIDVTRKHDAIADKDIERYNKEKGTREYNDYVKKLDSEMEERKLREIDRKRAIRAQKKKERRVTIAAIVAAVLVIAGLSAVFSAASGGGFFSIFQGAEKVKVPNVVDMKLTDAQNKYKADGLSIIKASEKLSDKEAGTILEQDPPANSSVTKRDDIIIRVVVSAGNKTVKLRDYTKIKVDEAKKEIIRDGFKVNIVEKESSSEEKDMVISQEPAAGSDVSEGALITLYVSKGDKKDDKDKDTNKDKDNKDDKKDNNTSTNTSTNTNTNTNTEKDNTNNNPSNTDTPSGNNNQEPETNENTENNNNNQGNTGNEGGGNTGNATGGGAGTAPGITN